MSMMTKRSMETRKKEDTATVKLESAVEETQMMMMRMKHPLKKERSECQNKLNMRYKCEPYKQTIIKDKSSTPPKSRFIFVYCLL